MCRNSEKSGRRFRCAILDIGSNTVKLNIYEAPSPAKPPFSAATLLSQSQTVGLINYITNGILSDEGITRLCETVSAYASLARDLLCSEIICVATASLRFISNGPAVLSAVERQSGCGIRILSGEEEAALSFEAVMASTGTPCETGYVIDMGGGSTEIVGFSGGQPQDKVSLPFGCLSLHNRFISSVLPTRRELHEAADFIDGQLERIAWLGSYGDTAFLVGGTARAAGKLHCEICRKRLSNDYRMPAEQFQMLFRKYAVPGRKRIQTMIRVIPDRIHTVIPGLCAYTRIFEAAGIRNTVISFAGVRDGMILRRIKEEARLD